MREDRKKILTGNVVICLLIAVAIYCSAKFFYNFKTFSDKNLSKEVSGVSNNISSESSAPNITYTCKSNCKVKSNVLYNAYWKDNFIVTITDAYGFLEKNLSKSNISVGSNLSLVGVDFVSKSSTSRKLIYDIKLRNNVSRMTKEIKTFIKIEKDAFVNKITNTSSETTIPIYIELYES